MKLSERILYHQIPDFMSMVEVLRVEHCATRAKCTRDNQAVIIRVAVTLM